MSDVCQVDFILVPSLKFGHLYMAYECSEFRRWPSQLDFFFLHHLQIFKECQMRDECGNSYELSLVSSKCIGAYVRNKKNQNQVLPGRS